MKTMLLLMTMLVSLSGMAQKMDSTAVKGGAQMITIKTSAVCDMCKETLEKAMAYEKGVKQSTLDLRTYELTVLYDPRKTTPEKIRNAVRETGYDADGLPADPKAYERLNACCKKDAKH